MEFLNAITMGILQGLTEFLPVSSSGHLVLFQHFFSPPNTTNNISLDVVLHFGTLLAILVYFRYDLLDLIGSLFNWKKSIESQHHYRNRMIIFYLAISTLVTGVIYILFGKGIEAMFSKPLIVAIFLSVTGLIVFFSDMMKTNEIPLSNVGMGRSIIVGLGQGIAMLPGISRSGTTIATSLYCGIKRADAARYSFLLSIPAILAANASEFKTVIHLDTTILLSYICGALAAFISGYLVIDILIRIIRSSNLKFFAYYCWFVSAVSITLLLNHI
jgi:undecaprenyl-diphosphatase